MPQVGQLLEGRQQAAEVLGAPGVVSGQGVGVDGLAGLEAPDDLVDQVGQAGVGRALHGWRWHRDVHGSSPSRRVRSRIRARYSALCRWLNILINYPLP